MAERASHLVDRVLPAVPMRQWVLSLPFRLRYLLAWNHDLCREVLAVYARALRGFYRRRARRAGIAEAETGAVTAIQRFGSGGPCPSHVSGERSSSTPARRLHALCNIREGASSR
jgi:hypothetical protein